MIASLPLNEKGVHKLEKIIQEKGGTNTEILEPFSHHQDPDWSVAFDFEDNRHVVFTLAEARTVLKIPPKVEYVR